MKKSPDQHPPFLKSMKKLSLVLDIHQKVPKPFLTFLSAVHPLVVRRKRQTCHILYKTKIFSLWPRVKHTHYLMGLGPNPNKKSPRIAESRFGYLKVCSLIVQCQKNPKKQAIGEKSQNLFFLGEFTT